MIIEPKEFVEKFYNENDAKKKNDAIRFIDNLNEIVGEQSPSLLLDKEVLCKTFYISENGSICRQHYQKVKDYLLKIGEYFGIEIQIPSRTDVINSHEMNCYFRDIDDLLDFIDKVGYSHMPTYDKSRDLLTLKAMVVLGWHGFLSQEIAKLQNDELIQNDENLIEILHNGSIVTFNQRESDILKRTSVLGEYNGFPNGKLIILYGDNKFVFRPGTRSQSYITADHIIQKIKRFNVYAGYKNIMFRNLYKNAKFVEIANCNTNQSDVQKIISIMNCSFNSALNYLPQYQAWKNLNKIK